MPPLMINPFTIASSFFQAHENCKREKLDMAIHVVVPRNEASPEWKQWIREDARNLAIHAMWSIVPNSRTMLQMMRSASTSCRALNHYVIPVERAEFEDAFIAEVEDRLDVLTVTGRN